MQIGTQEEPLLFSKQRAAKELSVCLRTIDYLILRGELASVRVGRRRLIPVAALRSFIRRKAE